MTAGASHPAVAALLALGTAGVASAVVAMAWSVHARQLRLAERLARRQLIVTGEAAGDDAAARAGPEPAAAQNGKAATATAAPPVVIAGPDTIVAGDQARYRVLPAGAHTVVSWAAWGGAVSHCPDPAHPGDLLLVADEPGSLTVSARVREGMTERRVTKPVTAVEAVTAPAPAFPLRLFLDGWGLAAVAVLAIGFAAALVALGSLAASSFIALAAPLAALLTVAATARRAGTQGGPVPDRQPSRDRGR